MALREAAEALDVEDEVLAEAHAVCRNAPRPDRAVADRLRLRLLLANRGREDRTDVDKSGAAAREREPVATGEARRRRGDVAAAVEAFRAALQRNPRNVDACRGLALALDEHHRTGDRAPVTAAAANAAMAAEAANAWTALGAALEATRRLDAAAEAYERALARKADGLAARLGLGRVHAARNDPRAAARSFEAVLAIDPEYRLAHTLLAAACHALGETDRAWDELAWLCPPDKIAARAFEQPVWDGRPLDGRTLLIWADQKLGDSMHWLRYVPLVCEPGARIVVECQPRLVPLARRMAGIDLAVGAGAPLPAFDVHVPLTQLPVVRRSLRRPAPWRVPYISAPPPLVDTWRRRLAARSTARRQMMIGLSWAGRADSVTAHLRFMPLAAFAPLRDLHGIHLVSLQMGAQAAELLDPPPGLMVEDLQGDACSMSETAALMESLDLIVTVDTLVAHLAGALGRPVWVLLPYAADWRWSQHGGAPPLYPTMRQFRQTRPGDWDGVVADVRAALRGRS